MAVDLYVSHDDAPLRVLFELSGNTVWIWGEDDKDQRSCVRMSLGEIPALAAALTEFAYNCSIADSRATDDDTA